MVMIVYQAPKVQFVPGTKKGYLYQVQAEPRPLKREAIEFALLLK
ncbi:hypothetical protein [Rossellomorea vietnamensis]|nr:hypothetical protein [Rossellomorea vietnamensis]